MPFRHRVKHKVPDKAKRKKSQLLNYYNAMSYRSAVWERHTVVVTDSSDFLVLILVVVLSLVICVVLVLVFAFVLFFSLVVFLVVVLILVLCLQVPVTQWR